MPQDEQQIPPWEETTRYLPAKDATEPDPRRNARIGLVLFAIYLLLYTGFIGASAIWPAAMGAAPLGGVNVAILYGMGLIVAALLLALLYMFLCRARQTR